MKTPLVKGWAEELLKNRNEAVKGSPKSNES